MHRYRWFVIVAVAACTITTGCVIPGSITTFDEQFTSSTVGPEWVVLDRPGDGSNNELQCYRPANVQQTGGHLAISTKVDTSCAGHRYTSGMVQWRTANFTFGTLEFRARFAGGRGTWPAVWLLGSGCQKSNVLTADNVGTCSWPNLGSQEIDVAEIFGDGRTSVSQGVHTSAGSPTCTATTTDVSLNWHVYTLVWTKDSLTWKIDGKTTCAFSQYVPTTPMFVMINTAVGGVGGTVVDSTLPQQTLIDYIRVTP